MVVQECLPGLRPPPPAPRLVLGDCRLRDIDPELEQFAVDSRRSPKNVPGDRGLWVKSKCLNREEFVVVGWTDPTGRRSHIGALLLGHYTEDGRLHYAGRAGTGMTAKELKRLAGVLAPLQVTCMPVAEAPPRDSRFGSPLQLSKVHWVRPEVVVEVTYLTWTEDNLLRQVSYQAQREDKPGIQVVRPIPHPPGLRGNLR